MLSAVLNGLSPFGSSSLGALQMNVLSWPSGTPSPSVSLDDGSVSPSAQNHDTQIPSAASSGITHVCSGGQSGVRVHVSAHVPSIPSPLRSSSPSATPSESESVSL